MCVARRHPDVADVSRFDDVVKSLHRLLNRCFVVKTVTLEYVNIIELESLERQLDGVEDVLRDRMSNDVR